MKQLNNEALNQNKFGSGQAKPLVSVIMTAYNAEKYIKEALESIVNQSYQRLEIVVVDDGSTDNTLRIVRHFQAQDKRIRIFQLAKNSGPSTASNFALRQAQGKYVARLDADDVAYPDRIEKQVNFMEANPEVVMLSGQCDIIDEQGNLIGKKSFPLTHKKISEALFMINPVKHPACMFRKSIYDKLKIRYEKKYFISHDLKILFRLLSYGKLANLKDTLIQYRNRKDSITHKNPKRTFKETIEIRHWAVKHVGYKPSLKGLLVHIAECMLVMILPNMTINALFNFWRVKKIIKTPLAAAYRFALRTSPVLFSAWFTRQAK